MGNVISDCQNIDCRKCHWFGKVRDLRRTKETLNGNEDGPVGLLCPNCKTQLGIRGYLDYAIDDNKANLTPYER